MAANAHGNVGAREAAPSCRTSKDSNSDIHGLRFYLAGFLHLQIFDVDVTRLSWVGTIQISLLGATIFLVPISFGAMLAAWAFSRLLDA